MEIDFMTIVGYITIIGLLISFGIHAIRRVYITFLYEAARCRDTYHKLFPEHKKEPEETPELAPANMFDKAPDYDAVIGNTFDGKGIS